MTVGCSKRPCPRCKTREASPRQAYCKECARAYYREWKRRRDGITAPVVPEPPKDVEQKEPAVCDGGPDFPLDFRQAVAFVHGIGDLDPSADGESGRIGRAAVVMMLCADRDSNNAYAISRESRYDMAEVEETIRNLKDSGILRADQPGVLFVSEWDADEAGVAVVAFMLHAMAGAGIVRRQMEEDAPAP